MQIVSALFGVVLGGLCGLGAALAAGGILGPGLSLGGQINASGWTSDWTIGSQAANPWTRARVARHGLLALTKEEAVYFTRTSDEAGEPLTEACTYRVSGSAMPAQWWSVTLYNSESYLPDNTDDALSYDLTDALQGAAPDWSFTIATQPAPEGGWVSSRRAGTFDLTLRLYKPAPELIADPESVLAPPRVEKLGCGEKS